jgi:hypothetical protein
MKMTNKRSFTAEDAEENQEKGMASTAAHDTRRLGLGEIVVGTLILSFLCVLRVLCGECVFSFTPYPSASTHRIV